MAKRHRREGSKRWMGYVFSFFLGALLGLGGYVYLTREKALSPEDFSQKVFLADQIIQSQLYEVGIQKKNILLHQTFIKERGRPGLETVFLEGPGSPFPFLLPGRRKFEAKPFCARETRFNSVLPKTGISPFGGQGFGSSHSSAHIRLLASIFSGNGSSPEDRYCH